MVIDAEEAPEEDACGVDAGGRGEMITELLQDIMVVRLSFRRSVYRIELMVRTVQVAGNLN
jgi:hypothetical protein